MPGDKEKWSILDEATTESQIALEMYVKKIHILLKPLWVIFSVIWHWYHVLYWYICTVIMLKFFFKNCLFKNIVS